MDGKKISGSVPPVRVQRVWYLFKRQYRLKTKQNRKVRDLHRRDFESQAKGIDIRRIALAICVADESKKHREWIEKKLDQSFVEPGKVIGV